jgi:membrane-associated phospholipid phosphatase
MISLGLFTSQTLLSVSQIDHADASVPHWLASHRTPFLTDASSAGYALADPRVLAPLVGAAALVLILWRRWRRATFLVLAALVEVWGYALTSAFTQWQDTSSIDRDGASWTSFPAGRAAAAIAVYGALAFLLSAEVRNRWARAVFWALALAVSLAVATSVMYRGGDHLVDIAGGAAMGGGALFVALVAEHVAGIVAQLRREKRGPMVVP